MTTLRQIIEKFGDEALDAEISFRVADGNLNSDYSHSGAFDWHSFHFHAAREETPASFRFNVLLDKHRLVKKRATVEQEG